MVADPPPVRGPSMSHGSRLRLIGLLVLFTGLVTAGVVFYFDLQTPEPEVNSLINGYYKHQSAEMQRQWGNLGPAWLTLRDNLSHGTDAAIIAALAIFIALTCFYLAHRLDPAVKS
jgi:hypothetical protein